MEDQSCTRTEEDTMPSFIILRVLTLVKDSLLDGMVAQSKDVCLCQRRGSSVICLM